LPRKRRNKRLNPKNKRSLKRRINQTMGLSSFASFILLVIIVFIITGFLIGFLGNQFSMYTSVEIASYIETVIVDGNIKEEDDLFRKLDPNALNHRLWSEYDMSSTDTKEKMMRNNKHYINIVEYTVTIGDELMYDSDRMLDQYSQQFAKLDFLTHLIAQKFETHIYSKDGEVLGTVQACLSPAVVMAFYIIFLIVLLCAFIVNFLLIKFYSFILRRLVISPLDALRAELERVNNDAVDHNFDEQLTLVKPVSEVEDLMIVTNNIVRKFKNHSSIMMEMNAELEAQTEELASQRDEMEAQRDELESQKEELQQQSVYLKSLNEAYLGRTRKLQNVLDNVGQGFVTFGDDLYIDREYSAECKKMFIDGCELGIEKITVIDALFTEEKEFIEELYRKIFATKGTEREIYMSLLPDELEVQEKVLNLEHKMVIDEFGQNRMLIILTDITEKREFESQIERERRHLNMIVKILLNQDEFLSILEEFEEFSLQDFSKINQDEFESTLREIHTYKSIFGQYFMNHIELYLNDLESRLIENGYEYFKQIRFESIQEEINKDKHIIEQYIGFNIVNIEESYTVSRDRMLEIEQMIRSLLPSNEFQKVQPQIQSLRHKPVQDSLRIYSDYVQKLANNFDKPMNPLIIEGDTVYIDPVYYHHVMRSLVHLFRNSMDHGIETRETRLLKEKPENGTIRCKIKEEGSYFSITVTDDGSGIDTEYIRELVKQRNLLPSKEADQLTNEDIFAFIFTDGFTTKETATSISGRGVGLAALKNELTKLGGNIYVSSQKDKGTSFTITLPHVVHTLPTYSSKAFLNHLSEITSDYFVDLVMPLDTWNVYEEERIVLNSLSCLIRIKGYTEALMILSLGETTAHELVRSFMIEEVTPPQIADLSESVIAEVTNTILGNALSQLEEKGIYITIGIPAVVNSTKAILKHTQTQILRATTQYKGEDIHLSLLFLDDNQLDTASL